MVDLNHIALATEEDKANGIDLWARAMKATTWEEITMLSKDNIYLQDAISGIRQLSEDEKIQQMIEAREQEDFWKQVYSTRITEQEEIIQQQAETIQQKDETIQQQEANLHQKDDIILQHQAENARLKEELAKALAQIPKKPNAQ